MKASATKAKPMLSRRKMAILGCALLAGCTTLGNKSPRIAYDDKNHPLSDTAIFSCVDNPGYTCGISRVDDQSTWDHYNGGRTLWVRVLPGEHRIGVVASDGRVINWLSFEIKDAEPGHVYSIGLAQAPPPPVAHPGAKHAHGPQTASIVVSYKDLGKMDSYSFRYGEKSMHPSQMTASF